MRRPEHHPQLPPQEGQTRSRETESLSPLLFATQRPELQSNEQAIYDTWVDEVKAVFARVGAKNTEDFKRIAREKPESITLKELERVSLLMDRIAFAWRHDRLPPKTPEQQGELLEDVEIPLPHPPWGLSRTISEKGNVYFIVQEVIPPFNTSFVMDEYGEKGPGFSAIQYAQIIGKTFCYKGVLPDGMQVIMVDGKEVSRFSREVHASFQTGPYESIMNVQGKPAWLECEQEKVFVSLCGERVGDPEGYDQIKEFASYNGKLLFQARKGKHWHIIFDGEEVHPPTKKEETYRHFGVSDDQLLYTKTETTDWIVTKRKTIQVYRGENLLHEIKEIDLRNAELIDLGEGHVATIAEYYGKRAGDLSARKKEGCYFRDWIDGKRVGKKDYRDIRQVKKVGNALAHINFDLEKLEFVFSIDSFTPDFSPYTMIHDYAVIGNEIYFVAYDPKNEQAALLRGLRGDKIWSGQMGKPLDNCLPKIEEIFGKPFIRIFQGENWHIIFDGKELETIKGIEALGPPVTVGSHIVYWAYKKGIASIFDEQGDHYGDFALITKIEPADDNHCYVYGIEGTGTQSKIVRRLIEL